MNPETVGGAASSHGIRMGGVAQDPDLYAAPVRVEPALTLSGAAMSLWCGGYHEIKLRLRFEGA